MRLACRSRGDRARRTARRAAWCRNGRAARFFAGFQALRPARTRILSEHSAHRVDRGDAPRPVAGRYAAPSHSRLLLRLCDDAVRDGADRRDRRPCARDDRADRNRCAARRRRTQRRRNGRDLRCDARALQGDTPRRGDRRAGVHLRRIGNGQGTDGGRDSRTVVARTGAFHRDQLRCDSVDAAAGRTVRL